MDDLVAAAQQAVQRAYTDPWTLALGGYDLVGAVLVGMHSRTTTLWPFLLWAACAPGVRLLYVRSLHRVVPLALGRLARSAYAIAGGLALAGLVLAAALGALFFATGHIHDLVRWLNTHAGFWGVIFGLLSLAALWVWVLGMLAMWVGLTIVAYTEAAVDPQAHARDAIHRGWRLIVSHSGLVIGIAGIQALFVLLALGAQLSKQSGAAIMPLVWPAVLFAPVALSLLLGLTESQSVR
ncbi:MAG TPA: hypothetical protein VMV40_02630 [Acidiferrobacter sp.]|nr:hypothetical protein [Acidiferrobacter sp.]